MTRTEIEKLERYLRKMFNSQTLEVRPRPKQDDSVEVYLNGEFISVIFRDDEDGDLSYNFQMAILDFDLEEV